MPAKLDFNKNLDRYLSARKRWRPKYNSPFSFRLSKQRVRMGSEGMPTAEDVTIRKRFAEWYARKFPAKQTEDLGLPELEEDMAAQTTPAEEVVVEEISAEYSEPVKESVWSRLRARFARKEETVVSQQEVEQVFVEDMKADMKQLCGNFIGLVEQMGHRNRERVKNTQEFESIKEIFRKHNIIK